MRLNEAGAIQQRVDMLEDEQVRRRVAIDNVKQAMDDHYDRRQREIENLKARLSALPQPLRVAT